MVTAIAWNDPKSFKEYVERIRILRKSHASDSEVTAGLLKSMPTLYTIQPVSEAGGLRLMTCAADWSALIPMWKVALYRFSPN